MNIENEDAELICGTTSPQIFKDIMTRQHVLAEFLDNYQLLKCAGNPPCSQLAGCPVGEDAHLICFMRWMRNITQGNADRARKLLEIFENTPKTDPLRAQTAVNAFSENTFVVVPEPPKKSILGSLRDFFAMS